MRDDTTSRQTGQCAYFAAQAPQRMWPQGTSAVDFSGSKHIGHSSRSGVGVFPYVLWRFLRRAGRSDTYGAVRIEARDARLSWRCSDYLKADSAEKNPF